MSGDLEFNASSVDEAVQKAASELGIALGEVSYQILDEGSSGFLGIGARDSRILVSSTESTVERKESSTDHEEKRLQHSDEEEGSEVREVPPEAASEERDSEKAKDALEEQHMDHELLNAAQAHVTELLRLTGLGGEVSVREEAETIEVYIDSEDSGLLIGQKGDTIDSLQYLVNVSLYRDRDFHKKVVLDVGGYRERRVKAVQGMALRAAKRVSKDGKAVELPPMSSSERRAVHTYLKDDPRVTTSSDGKDEERKITILPT